MKAMQTFYSLFLLIFFAIAPLSVYAQGGGKRGDKIEALRIAFITERLNLSPQEAQTFWPVFNEHHAKLKEIKSGVRDNYKNAESASDAEIEKLIAAHFDAEQRTLNLQKEYYAQLKKVLPLRKIMLLHSAERDFKNRLLERIGEQKNEPPPMRGRRFRN